MKFYTNRIPTGSSKKSFSDLIKEAVAKNQTIKTASAAVAEQPVKVAASQKQADGCLTENQKKLPDFLKEKIEKSKGCSDGDKTDGDKKEEKEASAEVEIKTKTASEEKYEEERRTDVHHMEGSKDQQSKGTNGEPEDCGAKTNTESKSESKSEDKKEAKAAPVATKVAKNAKPAEVKTPAKVASPAAQTKVAEDKKDEKKRTDVHHMEGSKDQQSKGTNGEPEDDKAKKEASLNEARKIVGDLLKQAGFDKISNLNAKNKNFLKTYFKMYWPEEFVNALLADR